jgi:hypothetical protein
MVVRSSIVATFMVASALATAACGSGESEKKSPTDESDDDVGFVSDGSDATAAETDAQLVTSTLVSSSASDSIGLASQPTGGELEPLTIGDGARALYFPQTCLEVTADTTNHKATYRFDRCAGPNGLRAVSGVVEVSYEASPSKLRLTLTATNLTVNKATIDWSATAEITASGAARTMTWKAKLSGTSAGGRALDRTNDYAISWRLGEACFALEGSSDGLVGRREIRTVIEDFHRCRRECPDAGGKISVTNVEKNKTFELLYDGTNRATYVDPKGRAIPVPLLCGP